MILLPVGYALTIVIHCVGIKLLLCSEEIGKSKPVKLRKKSMCFDVENCVRRNI